MDESSLRIKLHYLWLVALLVVAACAPVEQREAPVTKPALEQAEALASARQYAQAAAAYLELAQAAAPPMRDVYLLRAAELFLRAQGFAQAQSALQQVERSTLQGRAAIHFDMIAAELALERAAPAEALAYLIWEAALVPPEWQLRYRRLRAVALGDDGQLLAAARERIQLSRLIADRRQQFDNRDALFSTLLRLRPEAMQREMQSLPAQDLLRGWLALAHLVKTRLFQGKPMDEAMAQWRAQYPGHPAGKILAGRIVQRYQGTFDYPAQVALILPLSGRYAYAARAIRNGFFMAYYSDTGQRPAVRVYDTGGTPQGAVDAYRQAANAGAGWVIGPLDKQAVTAVLAASPRPAPLLTLNYANESAAKTLPASQRQPKDEVGSPLPGTARQYENSPQPPSRKSMAPAVVNRPGTLASSANPNVPAYQFGLMPEQEAAQVAAKMLADGHRRALVLAPEDEWGQRMLQAFVQRFTQLGGFVTDLALYKPNEVDHSATIQGLLGLSAGTRRARQLEQGLARNLVFVPHPRNDADALFLAAHPEQARLIKPQLRFYEATDLPVYGTSHLYAGVPQPAEDIDLNGIVFNDAPWILNVAKKGPPREMAETFFPAAGKSAGRLFALGADAYRVIPYLPWLAGHPRDHFPGLSGYLRVDNENQLHRRLAWAQFRSGKPEVVAQPLPPLRARNALESRYP